MRTEQVGVEGRSQNLTDQPENTKYECPLKNHTTWVVHEKTIVTAQEPSVVEY